MPQVTNWPTMSAHPNTRALSLPLPMTARVAANPRGLSAATSAYGTSCRAGLDMRSWRARAAIGEHRRVSCHRLGAGVRLLAQHYVRVRPAGAASSDPVDAAPSGIGRSAKIRQRG